MQNGIWRLRQRQGRRQAISDHDATAVYLGVCVLMQSLWMLALLPLVLVAIYRKVIAPEEAYLERRFGTEYAQYKQRVRRWL